MKRILSLILSGILIISMSATVFAEEEIIGSADEPTDILIISPAPFSDIDGHWAAETILKWRGSGVISGYPDGTFKPDNPVTRAELAKILTLAFELDTENEIDYTDVDSTMWHYPYIKKAASYIPDYPNPIFYGEDDPLRENQQKGLGGFVPDTAAKRVHVAEAVAVIAMEKGLKELEIPDVYTMQEEMSKTYKDGEYEMLFVMHGTVPANQERVIKYTYAATKMGFMQGYPDGYFGPIMPVTRAELLYILDTILDK